jgi:hypothetical protein
MSIHPSFWSIVRANIALLGVSTGLANLPFLLAHVLFEIPASSSPDWSYRASIAASGLAIMVTLRWLARRAYRCAEKSGDVRPGHHSSGVTITPNCSHAWLVQLYVELNPVHQTGCESNF